MKLEPLKDKEMIYEQDYIESSIKWNLELGDVIFKIVDIKLAIEWLKERRLGKYCKPFDVNDKEMIVFYKKDFDKAFEDVINGGNKK